MKVSELMKKAKPLLVHKPEDLNDNTSRFICHAIQRADGSHVGESPPSPEGKRAVTAVEMIVTEHGSERIGGVYGYFESNIFGYGMPSTSFEQDQAGRHRLLDFLITEFEVRGL